MTEPALQPDTLLAELERLDPEAQLARVRRAGSAEAVLLALADRAMAIMHTESARVLATSDLLVALADRAGVDLARARARHARARALAYVGRFEDALAACHEAVHIATTNGHAVEAGRARLASMHALGELGRLDEAVAVGHRAREEFLSADEAEFAARADINLGIIHQRRDRPSAALACFARARPHLVDPMMIGGLENARGEALLAVYECDKAGASFREALAAFEQAGATLPAAIAEGNLADLAAREGHLSRSLYFFEGARRRLEASGSPTHLARLLAEQAEAKALLGLPAEALDEYSTALSELEQCGLPLEAARARSGMGRVLLRLGRATEAETALAAAAAAFDELGHATARARVDLVRAELALERGRRAEAARMAARALAALDERPADAAAARHVMARCAADAGDMPAAEADLAAAIAAARRLDLAPLLADILHTRGRLLLQDGRPDEAVEDLTQAVGHVERLRGSLQAERFRTALLGDRAAVYEALVTALLTDGHVRADEAFAVAEQAKSRSLLEIVRGTRDPSPEERDDHDATGAALREDVVRVESELNALYSRLADDERNEVGDAAWREAVHTRERALAALESRLAASHDRAWLYAPPIDVAGVRERLAADEVLVEYFANRDGILAFVIGPDDTTVVPRLASMDEITDAIERVRFQVDRVLRPGAGGARFADRRLGEVRRDLHELDTRLLAPLRPHIAEGARLTIVPHGPLHLVPFHALWDGTRYLAQTHEVVTAPSAGLAAHLRGLGPSAGGAAIPLVVGVADDIAPGMEAEARRAGALLSCRADRVLTGAEATVRGLADRVADASVIHVATHGRYLPDNPFGSGLQLADRWLTLREIRDLPLCADLVTLSGCETGMSRVHAGDELIGLQQSFFVAGARALLVSLWRVDDESASSFMGLLYEGWAAANGATRDLRSIVHHARLQMLAERPHPAHWAPFTLVGKP